jgi:uncharacterized protein
VRIVVEDLPDEGRRLAGQAHVDLSGDQDADELIVRAPVRYDLEVSRLGSTVSIKGCVEAIVEAACSRCAERIEIPVDRDFKAVFVTPDTGETDRAVELDAGDLDLDYYQGGVIDGLQLLAEQIVLEVPMKALCVEDCRGLCATCGANLNHTDCDCEAEVDPRWASLQGLRDRL